MSEEEHDSEKNIKRRDFVGGLAALSASAAFAPAGQLMADEEAASPAPPGPSPLIPAADPIYQPAYPPGLSGLRGSHPGSFEVAHQLALAGHRWDEPSDPTDSPYDLVVVGGGVSGLAAALTFRQKAGPEARILILDNHDDFGGHAKRNEFVLDGETLIGYGGSESIASPSTYSKSAARFVRGLGIDVDRFDEYFDHGHYERHEAEGMGIYFDSAHYGVDRVVASPFSIWFDDPLPNPEVQLAQFPISAEARKQLLRLLNPQLDLLAGKSSKEKSRLLNSLSYDDFLRRYGGAGDEVITLLRNMPNEAEAVGYDALPASYAVGYRAPGTSGLGMDQELVDLDGDPYIHHFPDGNASVARLIVRQLLPGAVPGRTMDDIVLATVNYDALDRIDQPTRLRLQSTAIRVAHSGDQKSVDVTYVQYGRVHRVRSEHVILASYNQVIPYICPELPEKQKRALDFQEKAPLVYINVLLRNWQAFKSLGMNSLYSPQAFCNALWLDFPVSVGGYRFSREPDRPIVLHAVHVPSPGGEGLSMREQFRHGRRRLQGMGLEDYRRGMRDQLKGALKGQGFDFDRDVADMTVNVWPHGYAYTYNALYDDPGWAAGEGGPHLQARAQHHRISIANSDSEASAYLDAAIDAGIRAAGEQLGEPG
jgi:spermidine dehydrogenase